MQIFESTELSFQPEFHHLPKLRGSCLSIYFSVASAFPEAHKNSVYVKNALDEAEAALRAADWSESRRRAYLDPIAEADRSGALWENRQDGMAILINDDVAYAIHLPWTCQAQTVLDERFHLVPLLPLFTGTESFCLLKLSENEAAFFRGDRFHLEIHTPDAMPRSLDDALRYDDPEKQLQFHADASASAANANPSLQFHGQNIPADVDNNRRLRYFQAIDRSLHAEFAKGPRRLVVVCVDEHLPLVGEAFQHRNLVILHVGTNPEELSTEQLHERAWSIIEKQLKAEQDERVKAIHDDIEAAGKGSSDLQEIARAAEEGRVENCVVRPEFWPGSWDSANREWVQADPDERKAAPDLLNFISTETLQNGGRVEVAANGGLQTTSPAIARFRV